MFGTKTLLATAVAAALVGGGLVAVLGAKNATASGPADGPYPLPEGGSSTYYIEDNSQTCTIQHAEAHGTFCSRDFGTSSNHEGDTLTETGGDGGGSSGSATSVNTTYESGSEGDRVAGSDDDVVDLDTGDVASDLVDVQGSHLETVKNVVQDSEVFTLDVVDEGVLGLL